MKYPSLLSGAELLSDLAAYDSIIDVRSEAEFALDHIPGAINCPVLNNDERIRVGTLYKQTSAFDAKKIGAALVAKILLSICKTHFLKSLAIGDLWFIAGAVAIAAALWRTFWQELAGQLCSWKVGTESIGKKLLNSSTH